MTAALRFAKRRRIGPFAIASQVLQTERRISAGIRARAIIIGTIESSSDGATPRQMNGSAVAPPSISVPTTTGMVDGRSTGSSSSFTAGA